VTFDSASPAAPRTERTTYQERTAWIKRADDNKVTIWHRLQVILARLIPLTLLRPTVPRLGAPALLGEAERLHLFAAKGFWVPTVLHSSERELILSDEGQTLKMALDGTPDISTRVIMLEHGAVMLARLHSAQLAHGRPYTRDLLYDPASGKVGFLDLEEDPQARMTLADAQARDIWIYLCSAARHLDQDRGRINQLVQVYLQSRGIPLPTPLRTLTRILRPLRWILSTIRCAGMGKDVKSAVTVNAVLETYLTT